MNFEQKIKYLDYLEDGKRIRGAGFVRLECWGNTCNFILQASGLFEKTEGTFPVTLLSEGRNWKAGELSLAHGKGRWELRNLDCKDVTSGKLEQGMPVREVERLEIPLGEGKTLTARFLEDKKETRRTYAEEEAAERAKGQAEEEAAERAKGRAEEEAAERAKGRAEEEATERAKGQAEEEAAEEAAEREQVEAVAQEHQDKSIHTESQQPQLQQQQQPESQQQQQPESQQQPQIYGKLASLKPGKWEQLTAIYPPISPFGDSRKYLQISPGDFVILKDRSYRMVNNSFLLHGYFTYRHLILHKAMRKGETAYYVGVPGSFYDKEKEVAILFGFESFEGRTEPAREGDFGYYMMRVEL